jgi:hypothetical protein
MLPNRHVGKKDVKMDCVDLKRQGKNCIFTLNPATAPDCKSDSMFPGSR